MTAELKVKPPEKKKRIPHFFKINIPCKDEFELIEKIIFQYSASRCSRGISPLILRQQLIALLSLYFKYGYNKETKELAASTFNIKIESINSMNLELKEAGFLIDDERNKRVKHLNSELQILAHKFNTSSSGVFDMWLEFEFEQ